MRLKIVMILTVFITAFFVTPLVTAQEICYQVLIDDGSLDNTEEYHFNSILEVATSYQLHTGQNLDTTQVFIDTDSYFQYRTKSKIYYCEKVKVVTDKKGNKKYRRIKKKELYALKLKKYHSNEIASMY